MAKTNLFHIQEPVLLANGFTKEIFNNVFSDIIVYSKKIGDVIIDINYTYEIDDEQRKLTEAFVELGINGAWCCIPVTKLSDLLNLILILSGNE